MPEIDPITREEKLWSGEDIEPITREEMYIKHIFDKTQPIPNKPITRKEMLLEKAGQGGGGDVTIKQLSVTANGTYLEEGTAYSPVIVNVPKTPLSKLTVTENGTYTAPAGTGYDEVAVDVPLPSNAYLLKDIPNTPIDIATFTDGSDLPMPKLEVAIEPQQDLHGYDSPWVGGAGKNLIPMTVDGIKALNTAHQWSGNTYTLNGVTFTIETDSDENVIGINVNGTSTGWTALNLGEITLPIGTYTLSTVSPIPSSGIYLTHNPIGFVEVWTNAKTATITTEQNTPVYIGVDSGNSLSNYTFKPMIEAGSTATTFEPYSNICPISGWDEVNVGVSGINVWDEEWESGGLNPLNGETTSENDRIRSKNFRPCKPNMTMFYYIPSGKGNLQIVFYDINKNYLGYYNLTTEHTFTTPNGCCFFKFNTGGSYGTTYKNDISINYPSTDTSYHAYNGQTYNIQFKDGDNPLTVYGGTLDVVSGELTVDRVFNTFTELPSQYADVGNDIVCAFIQSNNMKANSRNDGLSNYFFSTNTIIGQNNPWRVCFGINNKHIYFTFDPEVIGGNTLENINNYVAINPIQVVYPLATPLTIQLTSTQVKSLLGTNNVWADTGDIEELEYFSKEA